jgi:hypothetical protein
VKCLIENYTSYCFNNNVIPGIEHFRHYLLDFLYPTREERLKQDVLWKEVRTPSLKTGISRNLDFDADFYILSWGAGGIGKIFKKPERQGQLGIKILNEDKRKEIEDFFYSYREKYCITGIQDSRSIGGSFLDYSFMKEKLIQHLYPETSEFSDYPEVKKPIHIERAIYCKELF